MKTEHLNYSRQLMKQFKTLASVPNIQTEERATIEHVIDLCRASEKYMLPENGELLPDTELRALNESEPIRLPHKFVSLEFQANLVDATGGSTFARRVIFCREDDDGIYIKPAGWIQANGFWIVKTDQFIPRTNYLDRTNPKAIKFISDFQSREDIRVGSQAIRVVLGFLNALQCSNVRTQKSHPKNFGKKIKAALPFDTYHVLTIDVPRSGCNGAATGGHRSPREHLRRGHIRRIEDGRRLWINATVVAAGKGAGKVSKDYRVRAAGNAA